jgi:4-aminobutyrate aminotransferase-like enzyme
MRDRGILVSTDGPDRNVIKIKPPLCFSHENVDHLTEALDLILQEDYLQHPSL